MSIRKKEGPTSGRHTFLPVTGVIVPASFRSDKPQQQVQLQGRVTPDVECSQDEISTCGVTTKHSQYL